MTNTAADRLSSPPQTPYIGRFAPTPSGELHFGSLLAALASYLDAKAHQGLWHLRIEDIDPPRVVHGATHKILTCLEAFGLYWDGEVRYQSQQTAAYQAALEHLKSKQLAYPCGCSRKEIADSALLGIDGHIYPGTCRQGLKENKPARAWRINTQQANLLIFEDRVFNKQTQALPDVVGDYILYRADRVFSYQLAVVVDDAAQHITHIVRGADLLSSTARQLFLQQCLGLPHPTYLHIPLALDMQGLKLGKQTLAPAIQAHKAPTLLVKALACLGQNPPADLADAAIPDILEWAVHHWSPCNITPHNVTVSALP